MPVLHFLDHWAAESWEAHWGRQGRGIQDRGRVVRVWVGSILWGKREAGPVELLRIQNFFGGLFAFTWKLIFCTSSRVDGSPWSYASYLASVNPRSIRRHFWLGRGIGFWYALLLLRSSLICSQTAPCISFFPPQFSHAPPPNTPHCHVTCSRVRSRI